MNQKKGARLALKLSLTVVIPIFLITIAGILLSAYKQSDLSEDLVKREISGIAEVYDRHIWQLRGMKSLS